MQEFDSHDYANALSKYLSSRFHPELPHIGTIGTADLGDFDSDYGQEESEVEEGESTGEGTNAKSKSASFSKPIQERFSSFRFVPFSASYRLKLKNQKNNLSTIFSFFIRTNEGSWHDLEGEDNSGYQKDDPDVMREKEFWLTKDELARSFRKFELTISTDIVTKKQEASLSVNESKVANVGEKIKTSLQELENGSKIIIDLTDTSEPFMIRIGDSHDVIQQKYHIVFEKSIQVSGDEVVVVVKIINKSPFTETSDIPQIEIKEGSQFETKEETRERYMEQVFTKSGIQKELYSQWIPKIFRKRNASWSANGGRYGHLLEFSTTEDGINSTNDPYENERETDHVINLVYDERLDRKQDGRMEGKIAYRNYIIFDEQIMPMVKEGKTIDVAKKIGLSEQLAAILSKKLPDLYKFQCDSIKAISFSIKTNRDAAVLISSRTGGGKTEAFLIPIIDYCISNPEISGTKAIIFYPTKALANDQTSRIIALLYEVNNFLRENGRSEKITVGLCHGDIPYSDKDAKWQTYWEGVPLRCPACDVGFLTAVEHTKVQCMNEKCRKELDFVILFQEPNFGVLPDIFVTNPDKIQYDMIERPDHHGIFGREISCCKKCYSSFAKLGKRKCDQCSGQQFERKKPFPPRFIVFDEVHQFKGTFGINSLFLHQRLKTMFKRYAKSNHSKEWTVCSIGSSATIANAKSFSEIFFGLEQQDIKSIPEDDKQRKSYYENAQYVKRTHLFVMPYRYRPASTCAKVVGYLQARRIDGVKPEPFSEKISDTGGPLQILGFVNSIQDIGHLVNSSRRERQFSIPVSVDGHSTDYDPNQRSDVERRFNMKDLNIIFATPTLEVGVDFDTVNSVIIYGFPYSFNDYVQRIGRGGRGENTLVVTICHNYKPIDHYFYTDAKKKIAEQHLSIEPIPISRDNPEVIKKHLVAAMLDGISSLDESPDIWENVKGKLLEELETRGKEIYDINKEFAAINALHLSAGEKSYYQNFLKVVIQDEITRLKGQIQNVTKKEYLHDHTRSLGKKYKLTNLRGTENEVKVEMIWEVYEG